MKSFRMWLHALTGRIATVLLSPLLHLNKRSGNMRRVRGLLLSEDGEVLLVKDWLGGQLWGLPGGGMHAGEDPKDALRREILEELGIESVPAEYLYLDEFHSAHKPVVAVCYAVPLASKEIPRMARLELLDARWFKMTELPADCDVVAKEALRVYSAVRN